MVELDSNFAEIYRQPVFILSCARSGSTMLRCIVDTHPDLCSPGHLSLGALCSHLYETVYYSLGGLSNIDSVAQRESLSILETRKVVDDILGRYAKGKGKKRWCEKSTVNIDFLPLIEKVFPDAKYICLYRNGLDVAYSCMKFNPMGFMSELSPYIEKSPDNFVCAMLSYWQEKVDKLIDFEKSHLDQCIRINYEALVSNPEEVLKKMFIFLGESWDRSLIDSIFKVPHDHGGGDVKVWFSNRINKDSIGNGVLIPLSMIPDDLKSRVNAIHHELGYVTIESSYTNKDCDSDGFVLDLNDFFYKDLFEKDAQFCQLRGICKFVITGEKGGVWMVECNVDGLSVRACDEPSDCTIVAPYNVFYALVHGGKSVIDAYENGEISGKGNVILALEFGRMVFSRQ